MRSPFYNDIYEILAARGREGLPVRVISKMVYNKHCSLFDPRMSYEFVYSAVYRLLWRQSRKPSSAFVHTGKWGCYALNPRDRRQLVLNFDARHSVDEEKKRPRKEEAFDYPSLFEDLIFS